MSRFVQVATVAEFAESQAKSIEVAGIAIALFKIDEQFFAIENCCPHAGYTLHDGELSGSTLTCILHGAQFDVRSGCCVGGLSCTDVETFLVKTTDDGVILLELP